MAREMGGPQSYYKLNLEMTLEWVAEQSSIDRRQQAESQHQAPNKENSSPAGMQLLPKQGNPTGTDETSLPDPHLRGTLEEQEVLTSVETRLGAIADSYSGKIALYNQHEIDKVIQVLILIQTTKAPGKKAEPLFKRFTKTDIAAILRQFAENNNKKDNTLQGYVTDANNSLRLDDPKVEKLAQALQDFFY